MLVYVKKILSGIIGLHAWVILGAWIFNFEHPMDKLSLELQMNLTSITPTSNASCVWPLVSPTYTVCCVTKNVRLRETL